MRTKVEAAADSNDSDNLLETQLGSDSSEPFSFKMMAVLCWKRSIELKAPLYRDHLGRDVVIDVEAPCRLVTYEAGAKLIAIVDGETVAAKNGLTARESLTLCSTEPLLFRAEWWETCYGEPPPSGRAEAVSLPRGKEIDFIDVADATSRKSHKLKVQNESEVFEHDGRRYVMHLNRMEFDVAIGRGVVALSRLYDRFHGRQRARVLVDGEMAGWWYTPEENRKKRWADSLFVVNPKLTRGKSSVRIGIDPPSGTPLWSVSEYRVFDLGKL